jgi:Domain of unknown function (DUF4838)
MSRMMIFLAMVLSSLTVSAGKTAIVKNGEPLFEIIYPADSEKAGESVYPPLDNPKPGKVLAGIIADYVQKSVGKRPATILDGGKRKKALAVHCGMTAYAKKLGLPLDKMDEDEFIITFPDKNNIVIAGKYQHGIEWGSYEFLERYFGLRRLFPGKLGEHLPKHKNLKISTAQIQDKPVFLSRSIGFDNKRKELTEWSRFSRLRRRIKYHHYLGVLFNPKRYVKTHPEYYPVLKGKRLKPESFIAWQPCFSAPGIAKVAAANIAQNFRSRPNNSTVSLGVNDNGGHCECEACIKIDGKEKNSIGLPDRSRSYYRFCSEVAKLTTAALPKRKLKFGLLTYSNVQSFPDGEKINPNIVPFLTTDAMKWLDTGIAEKEQNWIKKWNAAVPETGIYDYIYGGLYAMPRVYFHHMANYLRKFHSLGVKNYTAEAYITKNYCEGPKFYLTMKLLWNPNQSTDVLLKEWYECAVGPKAAPDVAAYFKLWEDFWTQRIPKGKWFNNSKNKTYLDFTSIEYYNDIREVDFVKMEKLLRSALAKADSDIARKRIQMWLDGLLESKTLVMTRKIYKHLNSPAFQGSDDHIVFSDEFNTSGKLGNDKARLTWGSWKSKYGFAKFSFDRKQGHKAPGCMMIDRTGDRYLRGPANAVFMRQIPVTPGAFYRLSVWVKADGAPPKAEVVMTVRWREKDGKTWVHFVGLAFKKSVKVTDGKWQKIEMIVPSPHVKNVRYATVLLGTDKTNDGIFRFDDFEMIELKQKKDAEKKQNLMSGMEAMLKSGKIKNLAPYHSFEGIADLKKAGYSIWPPKIRPSASLNKTDGSDGKQCVMFKNAPVSGSINRFFRKVKPGQKYYVAVDCKRLKGGRCELNISWRDSKKFFPKNSPYTRTFHPKPTMDKWETIGGIVTVPPKATILVYVVSVKPAPGADDTCLFDNFRVCKLKKE